MLKPTTHHKSIRYLAEEGREHLGASVDVGAGGRAPASLAELKGMLAARDEENARMAEELAQFRPDGTRVEVAGPGRRADQGFVFDGSMNEPIAVHTA